jgi:hypothetical protein
VKNPEADITRGAKAQALLQNPLFAEGFESVEKAIHEQWSACPIRDRDGAHELRLMLKLLHDVRSVFELAVQDGKLAADELRRLNEKVLTPKQWMNR